MLNALFDRHFNHVAWLDRDRYLFDAEMNWAAFIDNNNVWTKSLEWVGKMNGVICLDKHGKVVAWGVGQRVMGDPSIQKPKIIPTLPETPIGALRSIIPSPPIPAAPLAGWSSYGFTTWINNAKIQI